MVQNHVIHRIPYNKEGLKKKGQFAKMTDGESCGLQQEMTQ